MSARAWNVILVGETGVGKTSMTHRYVDDSFAERYAATVAIDHFFKDVEVNGELTKLRIWDSSGQEIYKSVVPQFFRQAHGCILVYDVTRVDTFHKLSRWLSEFKVHNEEAPVIIVGNKTDDPNCKSVARTVVKSFAEQNFMEFIQCSARTGENVEQAFHLLVEQIWKNEMIRLERLRRMRSREDELHAEDESDRISLQIPEEQKSTCC